MLSLVTPEKRVPEDHPLRQVKTLAEDALRTLSPVFVRAPDHRDHLDRSIVITWIGPS